MWPSNRSQHQWRDVYVKFACKSSCEYLQVLFLSTNTHKILIVYNPACRLLMSRGQTCSLCQSDSTGIKAGKSLPHQWWQCFRLKSLLHLPEYLIDVTAKSILKNHPFWKKIWSQNRCSLMSYFILFNCKSLCQKRVFFQDRWSFMALQVVLKIVCLL